MMKKFGKVAALLAAGTLLFGGLFLSCDDGDDDDDKKDPVVESDTGSGSEKDNGSTDNTGSVTWTVNGNTITPSATTKSTISAFDVSSATSVTLSLKGTFATDQNDWAAKILTTADNYIITIPNLDPWNNTDTADTTLDEKNNFPNNGTAGDGILGTGLAYNSAFTGKEVAITIALNKSDSTIVFTLDGATWVTYPATAWSGAISTFIGKFYDALTAGTLVFNEGGLTISEASITKTVAGGGSNTTASTVWDLVEGTKAAAELKDKLGTTNTKPSAEITISADSGSGATLVLLAQNGCSIKWNNGLQSGAGTKYTGIAKIVATDACTLTIEGRGSSDNTWTNAKINGFKVNDESVYERTEASDTDSKTWTASLVKGDNTISVSGMLFTKFSIDK